ncbi:hypothetical protein LDENG_00084790 [Lucifuga dentata]|nr:hypothetical protein LDENG_00084790 [Lucifuga dentata]
MNTTTSIFVDSTGRLTAKTTSISAVITLNENSTAEDSYGVTTSFTDDIFESTTDYFDYNLYSEENLGRCVYQQNGVYFLPALYSVFFVLGLLGNVLVVWVIACGVRLRSMTDVCLLNLAFADLFLVCCLPFLAHQARDQWIFGDSMCKIVLAIYHLGFYCGIFFISLMSIDRYLAIVHAVYALKTRTRSFGIIAAAVTWVAGFLASFPELTFLKLQQYQKNSASSVFCTSVYVGSENDHNAPNRHFWTTFGLFKMNILGLLIPILIMGFCYSQIIWKLLYCQSSKKQAIRLVCVVVAVFFCCWVPYNFAAFFRALELLGIYTECNSSKTIIVALQVTEAIAYSHSCLNPILYVFVGEKFRRHLLRLMNRAPCSLCRVLKSLVPQDRINASVYSQTTSLDERSTAM